MSTRSHSQLITTARAFRMAAKQDQHTLDIPEMHQQEALFKSSAGRQWGSCWPVQACETAHIAAIPHEATTATHAPMRKWPCTARYDCTVQLSGGSYTKRSQPVYKPTSNETHNEVLRSQLRHLARSPAMAGHTVTLEKHCCCAGKQSRACAGWSWCTLAH